MENVDLLGDSLKRLNLYNTSEAQDAYILDVKGMMERKTIPVIKFVKSYNAPYNEMCILIYKIMVSDYDN